MPKSRPGWLDRILGSFGKRAPASRSFRYLARKIELSIPPGDRGRTIVLTSPGSMKVSTETLLMFSYVMQDEIGCKVLLVDATFRDDGVGARLGHRLAPGFMELLYNDEHNFDALVYPTRRQNIHILPAGVLTGKVLPSLAPDRVRPILDTACDRFDYVLIQQGSVLGDTRYVPIARAADLILLLVEDGVTPVEELEECQRLFRDHQVSNIRVVMSKQG